MLYFGVNILHDDDPVDQKYIQQGIDWYDDNYGEYDANSGNIDWDFYE